MIYRCTLFQQKCYRRDNFLRYIDTFFNIFFSLTNLQKKKEIEKLDEWANKSREKLGKKKQKKKKELDHIMNNRFLEMLS